MSSIARQVSRRGHKLSLAAQLWLAGKGAPVKLPNGMIRSTARAFERGLPTMRLYNEIAAMRLSEKLDHKRREARERKRQGNPSPGARLRAPVEQRVADRVDTSDLQELLKLATDKVTAEGAVPLYTREQIEQLRKPSEG